LLGARHYQSLFLLATLGASFATFETPASTIHSIFEPFNCSAIPVLDVVVYQRVISTTSNSHATTIDDERSTAFVLIHTKARLDFSTSPMANIP
jgi:hypothetical protein